MLSNSDTNWLDEHTERGTSPRPSTYIIYITTPRITTINEQLTRRAFFVSRKHWQEEIKICQPAIYFSKSVIRMKLYHHQRQIHRNRLKHIDKFWSSIHHQSSHHHCVIVIVDVSSFILFFIASILCELEQKLILGPSLHCHTVTSMFLDIPYMST